MAATLRYGRERAYLGRSLLNFMRIARDAHAPDLTLGEVGDLLFTAIEVFIGHAFERPVVLSELSRNLEMPRDAVRRKLQRLVEIGLVERIEHRYYMTAKVNAPLQREVLLAHLRNLQGGHKRSVRNEPPQQKFLKSPSQAWPPWRDHPASMDVRFTPKSGH
jgi:biotin operon repressor